MSIAQSQQHLLEVHALEVSFLQGETWKQVLGPVSFSLAAGQVVALVGESGSGKSVCSLAIMGLLPKHFGKISGGDIWLQLSSERHNLATLSANEHRQLRGKGMAMIFQEPMSALNPVMRCGEQVAEAIRQNHAQIAEEAVQQKVLALFEEVQLPRPAQLMRSYPHELSGGQRQRVMIAMALACEPALLIADEPTTALDVTVQAGILELLKELSVSRGLGVLFITHDLGVVAQLADEVVVLYRGTLVEQGPTKELFLSPKAPYTKGLLACKPRMTERLLRLPTVADFTESTKPFDFVAEAASARLERQAQMYAVEPMLKVHDLRLWYTQKGAFWEKSQVVKAVDGVSFEVFPCETLGLVGESGSGKSTIGRVVAGLLQPTHGQLFYRGTAYTDLKGAEKQLFRRKVQVIFQDPYGSLNPRMRVGDALLEPLQVHGLVRGRAQQQARLLKLLDQVGLPAEAANRYPHEFSGGQRQRIVIARCLAMEPEFVVCDESVSALDVSVQAQVLNLLKSLQQELKLTYIFISHDMSVVKHLSDRVMVLQKGKCEELQEADALYAAPQSAYTKRLLEAIPEIKWNQHA